MSLFHAADDTEPASFDIFDPDFRVDSTEVLAAARVNWWGRTPIGLAVLRYAECTALLRDRRLRHGWPHFLASQGLTSGPFISWANTMLLGIEGDTHSRIRSLVGKAFTPSRVERLRPFMRHVAHRLIDSFAEASRCEFMTAFSDLYPAEIISELLGIPEAEFGQFLGWATDLGLGFGATAGRDIERIEAGLAGLSECCQRLIDERRGHPGDDLISALITVEQQGDRLSETELIGLVTTLVFAGQDTTRNQLALAVATFAEHPDQWALLAKRPDLAPLAVEEAMRVNSAIPLLTRMAIEDLTISGLDIPAGTHLSLLLAAAQREAAVFGDMAPFDITASRPAQLAFGGGVHYCLGASLARAEMQEALPILASRLQHVRFDGQATWRPPIGITGPVTLRLRFGSDLLREPPRQSDLPRRDVLIQAGDS